MSGVLFRCSACGFESHDATEMEPFGVSLGVPPGLHSLHGWLCDDCEAKLCSALDGLGLIGAAELRREEASS